MKKKDQSKTNQSITSKEIKGLLEQQTETILNAVDFKISGLDEKVSGLDEKISRLEVKLQESEERINKKIEALTTTLDVFLKRMTDMEDEFAAMKFDINRIKKIIKKELGIDVA